MTVRQVLRHGIAYAAYLGAVFCLCQIPGVWARQTAALAFVPTAESQAMHEFLVVIDAGHGGVDGGTQNPGSGLLEKNLSLEIARLVERKLGEEGIRTFMTRKNDSQVTLEQRSRLANQLQPDAFVSIHLNADADSAETAGLETYYCSRKRLGDLARLRERLGLPPGEAIRDRRSEWLARSLHQDILSVTGAENRGTRDCNYLVVMNTECPAVLIECGYLSNDAEARRLKNAAYQEKLATAVAGSLKKFLLAKRVNPRRGIERNPMTAAMNDGPARRGNP